MKHHIFFVYEKVWHIFSNDPQPKNIPMLKGSMSEFIILSRTILSFQCKYNAYFYKQLNCIKFNEHKYNQINWYCKFSKNESSRKFRLEYKSFKQRVFLLYNIGVIIFI